MRAIQYDRFGPPEVLAEVTVPTPAPGPGQVRVAVYAAAANPKDIMVRAGKLRWLSGRRFPKGLGYDLAGVVDAVGAGVDLAVGARVFGMINAWSAGALAEAAVLPAGEVAPMPAGLSFVEAAALPLVGQTALQALRDLGGVCPGQSVCVNGASGGVGTVAVQIARALGGRVTAVCSHRNADRVAALGAERVVDYGQADVLAGGHGPFDVFFDVFGNRRFREARGALTPRGAYIQTVPSARTVFDDLRTRRPGGRSARLVVVRSRRRDLDALRLMVEAGDLRPVVDRVLPLSAVGEGYRYLATRRARGKVVFEVRP